jgi:hypothetical protein
VTVDVHDKGPDVALSFPKSERAMDYLRWGAAFVAVVLVYGVAGWLLLRPTGWQRGVNGPVVEIDLSHPTQHAAIPPADRAVSSVEKSAPGTDVPGAPPGPAGEQQDVATKDHADEPVKTQPGTPAEKGSQTSSTDVTDNGRAGRPIAGPPRIVTPDHSTAASIMRAPIDASITVGQGRSLLRSAKGGTPFRGVQGPQLKLAPLAVTSPLIATSKVHGDLFSKKPTSVAGSALPVPAPMAPSANHGYTLNLADQPAMGADGRPARNAIGAIIERGTPAAHAGAPLGIHSLVGPSAIHASAEHSPATTATGSPLAASTLRAGAAGLPTGTVNQRQAGHPDQASLASHIATVGGPAIGGTAMIRPASSTAAVAGSAKAMTGVISGANVRMRHP